LNETTRVIIEWNHAGDPQGIARDNSPHSNSDPPIEFFRLIAVIASSNLVIASSVDKIEKLSVSIFPILDAGSLDGTNPLCLQHFQPANHTPQHG
jgi:hypothetical protein